MIYLDANATSRLRPEAVKALSAALADGAFANPSSVHRLGRSARALLREARREVLALLGSTQGEAELVFTSGGTEACNLMLLGFLGGAKAIAQGGHIVTSAIEHPAVLEPLAELERQGWEVSYVLPASDGRVAAAAIAEACRKDTVLVVLMAANNETGAVQPVAEAARLIAAQGMAPIFVSDATQAVGKTHLDVRELFDAGVLAIAFSGHKLGAPAGIGALVYSTKADRCYSLAPIIRGGPQEQRLRGGTENVVGALAFGAVASAVRQDLDADLARRRKLRDALWLLMQERIPDAVRLGPAPEAEAVSESGATEASVSNTLLVRFPGCRGDDLVAALDLNGVAASTGSACSSGRQDVSPSVRALGLQGQAAREVIRFSLDWHTSSTEVEAAGAIIARTVGQLRSAGAQELTDAA
ncbi:MAG: cysteine desulfurase [Bdellovibrionales bacterium]|nr:cysteine desulfurase [Bdellovibrionales bacterium]